MATKSRSLYAKLIWPIIGLSLLAMSGMSAVFLSVSNQLGQDFLKKRATEIAELVVVKVETKASSGGMDRIASAVGSYDDVDNFAIIDLDENVISASNRWRNRNKAVERAFADRQLVMTIRQYADRVIRAPLFTDNESKKGRYFYFYPFAAISENQRSVHPYLILLEVNDSDLVANIASFWIPSLLVQMSILLVFVVVFYLLIKRMLLNPIRRMLWAIDHATENVRVKVEAHNANDEMGELIRRYNHLTDKTIEYQNKLLSEKEKSEAATKAKSEFLATMTHELRTPLNGVIGMSDLLQDAELTDKHKNYLQIINQSGKQLLSVINDILDFSKIESGKLDLNPVSLELVSMIEQVVGLLQFQAKDKGLSLSFDNKTNEDEWIVLADDVRIRQILINLINNAIKFTHEGSVTVALDLELEANEQEDEVAFVISVKDTGIGLTQEECGKLFQKFSQADASTTRKFGGTGLGLAICRHLTEKMGGTIEVESRKGQGSEFRLFLPLKRAHAVAFEGTTQASAWDQSAYVQQGRRPKVLVVDDTPINQELAQAILEAEGIDILLANNGIEAVNMTADQSVDLVLMDCLMPEMDGFDATLAIRAREQAQGLTPVPIIALTASALNDTKERCVAAGMNDFLTKPLNSDQLVAKVKSTLLAHGFH